MSHQTRICPICQYNQSREVYLNAMAPLDGMDMSYTVARCSNCGFHYARELADDATFRRYYQMVSKYDVATKISALDQTRIDAAVEICKTHIPREAKVVDIGCGYGAFLHCLQQDGFEDLHGVDPAPNSGWRARMLFNLNSIRTGTMEEAPSVAPIDEADLVCMMAVLEHLPNLRSDLQNLLAQLKIGCRILVEVPAMDLFQAESAEPLGELSLEHIQFFGKQSLANLFSALGTQIIELRYQELPTLRSGGLFGLFVKTSEVLSKGFRQEPAELFQNYIDHSIENLNAAIVSIPEQPFVIYGAGSHTARLLPKLTAKHLDRILGIVDGNNNLWNKTLGEWTIEPPKAMVNFPDAAVLVSSYRSRREIAEYLECTFTGNKVFQMYA